MADLKIYTEDLKIAKSLIIRDERITRCYYYKQCYPLFKAIYDNYYTGCACCKEFMDEIYIVVLAPSKVTGKCQMDNYRGCLTLKNVESKTTFKNGEKRRFGFVGVARTCTKSQTRQKAQVFG